MGRLTACRIGRFKDWGEVLERWQAEGMPGDVHIAGYFGLDRRESVPISLGIAPLFKVEVLSEDERTTITRGSDGVVRRTLKSMGKEKHQTIPQFVRFPIETREDFSDFKKRLSPKSPCRYPLYWEDYKRALEGRDYPLSIHAGSVFGWLRNWMGLENIALMLYDDALCLCLCVVLGNALLVAAVNEHKAQSVLIKASTN